MIMITTVKEASKSFKDRVSLGNETMDVLGQHFADVDIL